MSRDPLSVVFAEGLLDGVVATRLLQDAGLRPDEPRLAGGNIAFWQKIPRYNAAAARCGGVFALADLEGRGCVGPVLDERLPDRSDWLVLRLAVPMLEAWLLADRRSMARALHLRLERLPEHPELLRHPKHEIVRLASHSPSREVRHQLVPRRRSRAGVGREYIPFMTQFVRLHWRPQDARHHSPSLDRALRAIERFAERHG